ncbi:MAG TPA: hypothetical protein VGS58_14495 [Candidatus Sulfopaludibacter sp.]|nr:hypothetical protein [Candidatus Sulfopaludibacter sp.]
MNETDLHVCRWACITIAFTVSVICLACAFYSWVKYATVPANPRRHVGLVRFGGPPCLTAAISERTERTHALSTLPTRL